VIYQQIQSSNPGQTGTVAGTSALVLPAASGKPSGNYVIDDLGTWAGAFRVQRNFLP
jgi:hypothetical protein